MSVDVVSEVPIDRPVAVVAGYAADPDRAPEWCVDISSVKWRTPPPAVGTRLTCPARSPGRAPACTYEVVELVPLERR